MTVRSHRVSLLALLLVVLSSGSAVAWSPAGHMVLGAIAYRELERIDPAALEAVLEILSAHPHRQELLAPPADAALSAEQKRMAVFMRAARWADDVREEPYDEYSRPTWHYVNFHYRPPDELTPPRGPEQDGYLLWALQENVRRLGSDSDAVRAVALTWLFHLVTDLHQPLHDVALFDAARPGGDRGGNLTFVRTSPEAGTVNLHWLWDGLLYRPRSAAVGDAEAAGGVAVPPAIERAAALADAHDDGAGWQQGSDPDFRAWSEQSARVAVEHVYLHGALPAGAEEQGALLPAGYLEQARPVAEARAVLGARRLAWLLADLF